MYISPHTMMLLSYVLFGIAFIILFYLFGHPDQENKALNIICLALFALAIVIQGVFKIFLE